MWNLQNLHFKFEILFGEILEVLWKGFDNCVNEILTVGECEFFGYETMQENALNLWSWKLLFPQPEAVWEF